MRLSDPLLRESLAAEYVLGTLQGAARRRFERYLATDGQLRTLVTQWQERVAPLAWTCTPVPPSKTLWEAIQRRIGYATQPLRRRNAETRAWRRAAIGLAAVLMITVATGLLTYLRPRPPLIAVLSNPAREAAWIAWSRPGARVLEVRTLRTVPKAADRSLELWAVPRKGAPVAVGLLPTAAGRSQRFHLGFAVNPQRFQALAVSLEPAGGAPGGRPTGPILFQGTLSSEPGVGS